MHATQALQSRRGNYSIIMGGTIITTLGFAALAVDISLITMAELQCQGAADAASHAALVAYRNSAGIDPVGDGTAAANFMVDRNPVAFVEGDLDAVDIAPEEVTYLCEAASRYFASPVTEDEIVSSYAGVRPLYEDNAASNSTVTRDYVFELEAEGGAPLQ